MFNVASLILIVNLFDPLPPPPVVPPITALPWPVPAFPAIPSLETTGLALDSPTHSSDYSDEYDALQEQITRVTDPISETDSAVSEWSLGDISPGADLDDTAGDIGSKLGTVWYYARSGLTIATTGTGVFLGFLLACAVLLTWTRIVVYVMQFVGLIWRLVTEGIQTITP